jgi:hypothetical protein
MRLQRNLHNNKVKSNMIMDQVITLWVLLTKCITITFITNGGDKLPWLPTDFISSQWLMGL